jgi:hypothetical protein
MKKVLNNTWRSFTEPPYRGLPWLVWFYVVLCFAALPYGGVFTGHLIGYDDQVRMVQVLNWVNGAGFYDRTILRTNAPEGFTTIWSRLVDIPLAVIVIIAQQFVTQKIAALVAAALMPLIELAVLFVAAPYFVRPLVGKSRARLIVLFLIFTSILNIHYFSASGFTVGEASHHPYYIILNLLMLGAIARLAMGSANRSPVLMLGGSIALFNSVGIEGFPLIAAAAAILALVAWCWKRPLVAARGAAGFLCGALGSFILLPMHQAPQNLFTISFAEPSILGAILVGTAGLFLQIEFLVLQRCGKNKTASAVLLIALVALLAGILISFFPRLLDGAAAGLSPAERKMALHEHYEAKPVYSLAHDAYEFISWHAPIVIGFAFAVLAIARSTGRRRAVHLCYFGFALTGTVMCEQFSRFYHHAMTTSCAWLLWGWEWFKTRLRRNRHYSLLALASFVAIGPFWLFLLPAIGHNAPITSQILLFPAAIQAAGDPCDSLSLADFINNHFNKDTLLDVPYWQSQQFLYQTDVRTDFLANYPSHDKFIDNYNFFGTRNMEEARLIAVRHHIDLVTACQSPFLFSNALSDGSQILMARLQGNKPPPWLKRIETPGIATNYLLYAVDKKAVCE